MRLCEWALSDSELSVASEDLPPERTVGSRLANLQLNTASERSLPVGLEGYSVGQTLRRCIQQGWLYKRSEGTLFNKYGATGTGLRFCWSHLGGGGACLQPHCCRPRYFRNRVFRSWSKKFFRVIVHTEIVSVSRETGAINDGFYVTTFAPFPNMVLAVFSALLPAVSATSQENSYLDEYVKAAWLLYYKDDVYVLDTPSRHPLCS